MANLPILIAMLPLGKAFAMVALIDNTATISAVAK